MDERLKRPRFDGKHGMRVDNEHPLDQLTGSEIQAISDAVLKHFRDCGKERPRFHSITLHEPSRQALLIYESNAVKILRQADVICMHGHNSNPIEIRVALAQGKPKVLSEKVCDGVTSLTFDEVVEAANVIKKDSELLALLEEHGIPPEFVVVDAWPVHANPGEIPTEQKWIAGFLYWQPTKDHRTNHYAHPLPWMPIVDYSNQKVVRIDNAHAQMPALNLIPSEYHQALQNEPMRTDLKPISVTQPEGSSFEKWQFRVGFNYREGAVLHGISYRDGECLRPVLYRMSVAEMCVPYGDPQPPFNKKLAFDAGDVGLGLATNSLSLGCDCIGTVHYFDGIVNNSKGQPVLIKNAVCLHEEDDGMSWKHTVLDTKHCELRRGRRLVVQFICTLANYEYAFAWHFKTDASIAFEVKLTGILSTHVPSSDDADDPAFASVVHPGVSAQFHQHLFCARMDWACDDDTDGADLIVSEVDVELLRSPRNFLGNAFTRKETDLLRESEAQRMVDPSKARIWKVKNLTKKNPVTGLPVSWKLVPANSQTLLGLPGSTTMTRAGFASKSLWVTPYQADERWVGGKYPLQNPNPGGILDWTRKDREIKLPVMWHVFGTTHIPRPEDFPVMPVETIGFHIKPVGFFSKNPASDLPAGKDIKSRLHQAANTQTAWQSHL